MASTHTPVPGNGVPDALTSTPTPTHTHLGMAAAGSGVSDAPHPLAKLDRYVPVPASDLLLVRPWRCVLSSLRDEGGKGVVSHSSSRDLLVVYDNDSHPLRNMTKHQLSRGRGIPLVLIQPACVS
eukprot:1157677-Pelagomonas_calceolata.AAC.10